MIKWIHNKCHYLGAVELLHLIKFKGSSLAFILLIPVIVDALLFVIHPFDESVTKMILYEV